MENQPTKTSEALGEYLNSVTGSDTLPNAQPPETSNVPLVTRRWFTQGLLALTGVKGLSGKTDPCPSPPCDYKMGD